jgi:biopolymer transport protein ExbD
MRRKRRPDTGDSAEVPMSPLIDCVFLLLIFFLVTSMLKRKEMLIPIQLPDQTAAVADTPEDNILIIGLDEEGRALRFMERTGENSEIQYELVGDLAVFLRELISDGGAQVLKRPLRLDAARDTPFQKAIDALDTCKLAGFSDVGLKTKTRKE